MALLEYFKRANLKRQSKVDSVLLKLDGLLSEIMLISCIEAANTAAVYKVTMKVPKVQEMECDDDQVVCWGKYQHWKASIG